MIASTQTDTAWRRTLDEIAARNGTIEIATALDDDTEILPTYRARLLESTSNRIVIEAPGGSANDVSMPAGWRVRVHAYAQGRRWQFTTRVMHALEYPLSNRVAVTALALAQPEIVHDAQRREHFRVNTTTLQIPPVRIMPVVASGAVSRQFEHSIVCRLLNLSGGGIGIEAPRDAEDLCMSCRRFHCELRLPGSGDPERIEAQLVNMQVGQSGGWYVGLRFLIDQTPAGRRTIDRLCKAALAFQRQQIAKQRSAGLR